MQISTSGPSPFGAEDLPPVKPSRTLNDPLRLGQGDEGLNEAAQTALFRTLLRGIKEIEQDAVLGSLTLSYHLIRLCLVSLIGKNEEDFSRGMNTASSPMSGGDFVSTGKRYRAGDSCLMSLETAMQEIKAVAHQIQAPPVEPAGALLGGDFETAGSYALKQFAPLIGMVEQILAQRKEQDQARREQSEIHSMLELFRTAKDMGLTLPEDTQARVEAILAAQLNPVKV